MSQTAALPAWPVDAEHLALSAMVQVPTPVAPALVHVIPSLSLGGAERIGIDLAARAAARGLDVTLVVMRDAPVEHSVPPGIRVVRLGRLSWPERIACAAAAARRVGGAAYCHLTSPDELRKLWAEGVDTVPVVHNVSAGWKQVPSDWAGGSVPYVVACGDRVAADLAAAGCPVPVVVLRHVADAPPPMDPIRRNVVRNAMGAGPGTLLVGMVGRVVPQKDYPRAVEVLAELVRGGADARLAVIGPVPDSDTSARDATVRAAVRLGVRDRLLLLGGIRDAARLVPSFDVFLNTSAFEGVSISTMEAVAAGVPVVTADVGGQDEAVGPRDVLLPPDAGVPAFAAAVLEVAARPAATGTGNAIWADVATDLWSWCSALRGPRFAAREPTRDVLFVTGNLDVGGAQRSLVNLSSELARRGGRVSVAVCGPVGVPDFLDAMLSAGVECLDLSGGSRLGGPAGRMGRVLSVVLDDKPRTVCFWNMDATTKMAVAKALSGSPVAVVDASPGPALFRELDEQAVPGRLMSSGTAPYLRSLDGFVSKYDGGLPAVAVPGRLAVIPNGVRPAEPLPDGVGPSPAGDPSLSVLVVGRLNATKRVDLLARIADGLAARVPGATVTAVGGVHVPNGQAVPASPSLRFLPPDTRASGFAHRFACFLMLSHEQGCPNASLEAMAAGIPVVANDDGGTREQVVDGLTGRLLPNGLDDAPLVEAAVSALAGILLDPARRRAMGEAARARASERFTVGAMADAYLDILAKGTDQ